MSIAKDITPRLYEKLAQKNDQLFWGGVALAVVGVLALIFPVAATFAVAVMVGWLLVLAGAVTIYDAFTVEGTGSFFGELLIGLIEARVGRLPSAPPRRQHRCAHAPAGGGVHGRWRRASRARIRAAAD